MKNKNSSLYCFFILLFFISSKLLSTKPAIFATHSIPYTTNNKITSFNHKIEKNTAHFKDDELLMEDDPLSADEHEQGSHICDPWEKFNRSSLHFNQQLNRVLMTPLVKIYRTILFQQEMRTGVNNFLMNLNEPLYMINHLLQGEGKNFLYSLGRFVFNSTLGIGGIVDFAGINGLHRRKATFGDTFIKWGGCQCNYVVLPFFGPHTTTRSIGLGLDVMLYPVDFFVNSAVTMSLVGMNLISVGDKYSDDLNDLSSYYVDPYSVVRSAYSQKNSDKYKKNCPCRT